MAAIRWHRPQGTDPNGKYLSVQLFCRRPCTLQGGLFPSFGMPVAHPPRYRIWRWVGWSVGLLIGVGSSLPAHAQVTFGPVSGGNLVEAGGQGRRLESSTSGQFTVTVGPSTPNTTLQLLAPVFVAGPSTDPGGTTYSATADVGGTILTSGGTDTETLPQGATVVQVDMQVERPVRYPAGTYQYSVDVVVTPN